MVILMDKIDRALIRHLEHEGRLSFADLSERAGLSKAACWKRVQTLEAQGVIRGYRAELDAASLGLGALAFVQVTVAFERHEAFEQAAAAHPAVLACHATVGATDYLLQVIMPDMAALDDFLRQSLWRLPGVERFSTTLAMRTIKDAGRLSVAAERPR